MITNIFMLAMLILFGFAKGNHLHDLICYIQSEAISYSFHFIMAQTESQGMLPSYPELHS